MSEGKIVYKINVDTEPFIKHMILRMRIAFLFIRVAQWISRTELTMNIGMEEKKK